MEKVIHKAESRGHANHGWLDSYHTFSFANYYDPERIHFGALRVLNDDTINGGMGFGEHPHKDMEIISIPLEGNLRHSDSMGNSGVIKKGEVQVMSAGTGIVHSEMNNDLKTATKFLQIWVFPREQGLKPRYDQVSIIAHNKQNDFQQIVSPNEHEDGAWIHQDAWMYLGNFEKVFSKKYVLKKQGNGAYIFILKGKLELAGEVLEQRDGMGVTGADSIMISALENTEFLIIVVPMMEV